MRLRVVFLHRAAPSQHHDERIVQLVRSLAGRVEAHVILDRDGPVRERLLTAGASVEVLPAAGFPLDVWRLAQQWRETVPHLVHVTSSRWRIRARLAGRIAGVPVVRRLSLPGPVPRQRSAARLLDLYESAYRGR
jgi:hypothetical protein